MGGSVVPLPPSPRTRMASVLRAANEQLADGDAQVLGGFAVLLICCFTILMLYYISVPCFLMAGCCYSKMPR
jgi:hypothetical protein